MKTITEIIGGAQGLLDIPFDLQDVFEEYLTEKYKTFLHTLRVLEGAQPPVVRGYAGTKIIHVCDREGGMYELFCEAVTNGRFFLVRAIHNRMTAKNGKILDEIRKTAPRDSRGT